MQTNDRHIEKLNFVKTVLMLIIVAYHSILCWSGTWFGTPVYNAKYLALLAEWLNTFHIYAFTFVSGYIYYYIRYELKKRSYENFPIFLKNKVKRLIIPYISTCILWVIPVTLIIDEYTWRGIFNKYILGSGPSQLWFLLMLFNVFIISFFTSNYWAKKSFVSGILILLIFYLVSRNKIDISQKFMLRTGIIYLLYFYTGFICRKIQFNFNKNLIVLWTGVDIILFYLYKTISFKSLSNLILFSALLKIVGIFMIVSILLYLADRVSWKENKVFKFVSKRSMLVYLFHQQLIYFTIVWFNGVVNPYMNAFINFIFSLGISLIMATIILKSKTLKIMFGEK